MRINQGRKAFVEPPIPFKGWYLGSLERLCFNGQRGAIDMGEALGNLSFFPHYFHEFPRSCTSIAYVDLKDRRVYDDELVQCAITSWRWIPLEEKGKNPSSQRTNPLAEHIPLDVSMELDEWTNELYEFPLLDMLAFYAANTADINRALVVNERRREMFEYLRARPSTFGWIEPLWVRGEPKFKRT